MNHYWEKNKEEMNPDDQISNYSSDNDMQKIPDDEKEEHKSSDDDHHEDEEESKNMLDQYMK